MIAHHEQAIEMAEIAQDPARQAGADVVDLAERVEAAQDPEIELMTGWLEAWGQPRPDGHLRRPRHVRDDRHDERRGHGRARPP